MFKLHEAAKFLIIDVSLKCLRLESKYLKHLCFSANLYDCKAGLGFEIYDKYLNADVRIVFEH